MAALAASAMCFAASGQEGVRAPASAASPADLADEAAKAVSVRLVCDSTALVPGRPAMLAIVFDIAPGWNLYWRNPGDSGAPIEVEFDLPDGIAVGEALWPAPEREVLEGDILDYVYRRRATLLFPVSVSPGLHTNTGPVKMTAHARWLVCREACIPGSRSVTRMIPISSEASPGQDRSVFDEARTRLPVPPPASLHMEWRGRTLVLALNGADELTFFPYETEPMPDDALERGRVAGGQMQLTYKNAKAGDRARGVLAVRRGGTHAFHEVVSPAMPGDP